jgi:hypothetical protein
LAGRIARSHRLAVVVVPEADLSYEIEHILARAMMPAVLSDMGNGRSSGS